MQNLPLSVRMSGYEPVVWEQIPDLGLYMDQVVTYTEKQLEPLYGEGAKGLITPSMVNNYVKTGLLPRPLGKKYYREHLALLMMIVMLKPVASMEDIARLTALKEEETVETLYSEFCRTQEQVFRAVSAGTGSSALGYAVTATACRLMAEEALRE